MALLILTGGGDVSSPGLAAAADLPAQAHARADQALQSFLLKFWSGGRQYLRNQYPSDGTLSSYWTYANGWDAVLDGVERTAGLRYAGWLQTMYLGQDQRGWYSDYYDDECWMTLALLRACELSGDAKYLTQAQVLYADIMGGWDTNCCGAPAGGLWWDKAHTQKATAANAGAALAGARLYRLTSNAVYLNFAEQLYAFWYANMVNGVSGQVCDHLNPDGTKVWWRFTYNEGLMLGASVELNEATGQPAYLANAHRIAGYMVANEVASTPYGPALSDGSNSSCNGDCHQFKGPAYRYLARLYSRDTSRTAYYNVLKGSADALWNLARETNATIFSVSWSGPATTNVDQAQQNAACMALNRYANLLGAYTGPGTPPNQYEAEDAVLHNLAVETNYGAFTGWAYVASWNGDGQTVEFNVNCATAGSHTLTFRYAAGAGNAFRAVAANGSTLAAAQAFPATGSWNNFATAQLACTLPQGASTISVAFDTAKGSANYLNLDNLVVTGDPPERIILAVTAPHPASARLTWNTRPRSIYQPQYRAPDNTNWFNLGSPLLGTNSFAVITNNTGGSTSRLYRVFQFY